MNNSELCRISTDIERDAYHRIRRTVLFENRGVFGEYDPNFPDDVNPDNHAVVLKVDGSIVGAMRLDFTPDKDYAIFRTVAILPEHHRKGFGRAMLDSAERYAVQRGRQVFVTNAATDAVPFYEKNGFYVQEWDTTEDVEDCVQMRKDASS